MRKATYCLSQPGPLKTSCSAHTEQLPPASAQQKHSHVDPLAFACSQLLCLPITLFCYPSPPFLDDHHTKYSSPCQPRPSWSLDPRPHPSSTLGRQRRPTKPGSRRAERTEKELVPLCTLHPSLGRGEVTKRTRVCYEPGLDI